MHFIKNEFRRLREEFLRHRLAGRKKKAARLVSRGDKCLSKGAVEKAFKYSRKSLALDGGLASAHHLMARALMPGEDYLALIARIHNYLKPESYVEIGVAAGESLELAGPRTKSIGIDPNPKEGIKTPARLFRMPSNEFFESFNLFEQIGTSRLSLAFIDGLHIFEQALMDFMNIERYGDRNTVVLVHDCLPITRPVASRERATDFWCGDVWKVIAALIEHRPDLRVSVVPAGPSGLGVITNLVPDSTVLSERYESIVTEYMDRELDYDWLDFDTLKTLRHKFHMVPNDWGVIVREVLNGA